MDYSETLKSVKSIEDIGKQTEACLLSEIFINMTPRLIVDDMDNKVVSGEAGREYGQSLPNRDVQRTTGCENVTETFPRKGRSKYKTQSESFEQRNGIQDIRGDSASS